MAKSKNKKAKKRIRRRGEPRTPWHLLLFLLLQERAPSEFQVQSEVPLGLELPRADLVLLRRDEREKHAPAGILRGLWPLIALDAVVEFKSVVHDFRRGELGKLQAYSGLYFWHKVKRLNKRDNLLTVLMVASMTPTLTEELEALGFAEIEESGENSGYRRYNGGTFPLVVAEVDRIAQKETDELLGFLGHGTLEGDEACNWLFRTTGFQMDKIKEMDEFPDFKAKLIAALGDEILASMSPEQRLAGLPPEQRLAGLPPEQRLAGLPPEQRLAGLPPEQRLAGLTKEQKAELRRLLDEQN